MQVYKKLIASGEIEADPRQEATVEKLDRLCKKVANYSPKPRSPAAARPTAAAASQSSGGGWLGGLFGGQAAPKAAPAPAQAPRARADLPGLYVWGSCGTGKTFLMDLFYEAAPVERKRRIHFHEWMIDVHERLHRLQKQNAMVQEKANTVWTAEGAKAQREQLKANAGEKKESANDLVEQVAKEMMDEGWLLCFDEFQVTHISDAIIMKRLFSILFERGAVVVATSNRPPEDLYLNGLNRPLFLPFIPMLKDNCDVHDIGSAVDYRLATVGDEDHRVYIHPNGKEEQKLLERKFYKLARGEVITGHQVETQGRRVVVPKCAAHSGVAWFRFKDLCDKPLGAADYLAVAENFHTVFVADIPRLTMQERDQVRRFITMVDAFYEKHTKLVCTADLEPYTLFSLSEEEKRNSTFDEVFAWDRTVSRLIEMQSVKYLSEVTRLMSSDEFLGQFDLAALLEDEKKELWRRYDFDDSGCLDRQKVRVMFEDILETYKGHRQLSDKIYVNLASEIDADQDGQVSFDDFDAFFTKFDDHGAQLRF